MPVRPQDTPQGRRSLLQRFANPWIGLVGTAITILSLGFAVFVYLTTRRTRELSYSVNPVKTAVVKTGQTSTLRVLFVDQEIKSDVTAAQVAVWNQGTETIRPENVLAPIQIVTSPPVRILEATIRKTARNVTGFSVDNSRLSDGAARLSWRILEHNDGAVVQLIYVGSGQTRISVEGTVEGQPAILNVQFSGEVLSPAEQVAAQTKERRALLLVLLLVTALALGVSLVSWREFRRRLRDNLDTSDKARLDKAMKRTLAFMLIMWSLLAIATLDMVWSYTKPVGPPFGF